MKAWDEYIAARDLAEKRRVAPGWLDSEASILEPVRKPEAGQSQSNLMDVDVSSAEASGLQNAPVVAKNGEGDELDRAFGGMALQK